MTRVLLAHRTDPFAEGGGSEVYVAHLAAALAQRAEVAIVHPGGTPAAPPAVTSRDHGAIAVFAVGAATGGFEAYRDPASTRACEEVLEQWRPDVVHVHHLHGLSTGLVFAARRRGVPVVVTLHDFWPVCALGQLVDLSLRPCPGPSRHRCLGCVGGQLAVPPLLRAGLRRLPLAAVGALADLAVPAAGDRVQARLDEMLEVMRSADALLSPSLFLRERLHALGVRGIEVLANGHRALARRPRTSDAEGRLRIGFVGTAIPTKGVHVLAEAFRRLDPARVALAVHGAFVPYHGDTTYEARVRRILGHHATDALRGPFPRETRDAVLAALDVLVVPSVWAENAPLVVEEAFQAGVPVVVSDHGGLRERVRHEVDGLRFAPGDPAALAAALRRFLDEPALGGRLAAAAPPVTTMETHASALVDVYHAAARRHRERVGRVGVVVVDYGRPQDAQRALASARDATASTAGIIVDNAPDNRGYAAGANRGIAALRAEGCDRILLLNNDAVLEEGALRRLAEVLTDEPDVAAVGPLVLRATDGRVESRGARLGPLHWPRLHGHGEAHTGAEALREVESLSGAAWMIRVSVFDEVGLLDEAYFHGFEDTDWCLRARAAGHRLVVRLGAVAHHEGSRTLGAASPLRLYYAARNHGRVAARGRPAAGRAVLRDGWILAMNLAHVLRQREVARGPGLRAVVRGAIDAARGRSGPAPADGGAR